MEKSMLLTAFVVLPLLVSCTANAPQEAPSSTSPMVVTLGVSDSEPRFIHSNYGLQEAALQALLQGTLVTGPGNCLGVKDAEGTVRIPAFPGTTVITEPNGGAPGIDIEGHKYTLGDEVKFAGGGAPISETDRKAITECNGAIEDGSVFFIQQISH